MKYLLILLIFASCSTAQELMDKAEKKDPAIVAKLARDKYPCKDLLKPDTTTIYQDSLVFVEVECPDDGQPVEVLRVDTVNNVITRTVRVPVNMPVQVKIVTRWYEDSAKQKLFTLQVNALQSDTASLRQNLVVMTGKRDWFRKYFYVELGILILLLLYAVYRIWKNMTTIKMKSV